MSIFASILRSVYKLSGAKKAFALPEDALRKEIEKQNWHRGVFTPIDRKAYYVVCNKPFWRKLMYRAFVRAKRGCDKWHDYEMSVAPYETDKPIYYEFTRARQRSLLSSTVLRILCPPCVMWTLSLWSCSMQGLYGRTPA